MKKLMKIDQKSERGKLNNGVYSPLGGSLAIFWRYFFLKAGEREIE